MPLLLPFDFLEEDMSFDCREQGCEKKKKKTTYPQDRISSD